MDESLATPVAVHPTAWDPSSARAVLNVTLDAALVPSSEPGGCRADAAHVVVLDGLLEGAGCSSIRERLCPPPGSPLPADSLWERRTADTAGGARTFGLRDDALAGLITRPPPGLLELQSRLALLYPEATLCHQPRVGGADDGFACERLVANAACGGDSFAWHQDADPATFPPGAWADAHGRYANRERGRPLFLSALLYLDAEWPLANDAETLFLDPPTGCGVFVRPSQGRVVLMDQDVTHRLSPPSSLAGRPRYSLVLKLVLMPRGVQQRLCIARPEWGRPCAFGSAARLEAVSRTLLQRDARGDGTGSALKRAADAPPPVEDVAKRPAAPTVRAPKRGAEGAADLDEEATPGKWRRVSEGADLDKAAGMEA